MNIRVPATTANIGSGFDCFGMALNLYNYFEFTFEKPDEKNLISDSFEYYFNKLGKESPDVKITVDAKIPQSRGLGSSATCIVAGLMAANELNNNELNKYEILKLASEIEGHPDNVASAIFGGHTIAYENQILKIDVSDKLKFYALTPDFEMSTEKSRTLVKKELSVKDAVKNIAGAAFITNALRIGDLNLIINAPPDTIHELKRLEIVSESDKIKKIFENKHTKILLSGSGSTLLLIAERGVDLSEEFSLLQELENNWTVYDLEVDNIGAIRIDI